MSGDTRHAERFTYALLESGSRAGRPAVRMRFNERLPGAIVQSNSREAVRTEVDAWIDLERGAVLDATVDTFEGDSTQVVVRVRVRFSRSAAVDLLVPQRMDEAFQPEGRGSATYSNYRRFSTAGRIVPKGMDRH
ncbi:MAG: hypothetical protein IT178_04425 [Acidobacteria bacterium]|nr:hypothetical protein [Acidobacteriota bacterium]